MYVCMYVRKFTSNVTGRHRRPKRKLRAGVACAAHLCGTWCPWWVLLQHTALCCDAFSSSSVVSRDFSALCVYSKFEHHLHLLDCLCAKFRFFRGLHCWANPRRKVAYRTYLLIQLIWCPGNRSFRFGITRSFYSLKLKLHLFRFVVDFELKQSRGVYIDRKW